MKDKRDFLVDIVYLWCDGNDKEFIKRKAFYQGNEQYEKNEEAVGNRRFFDNDELKYSLRSLEMNAPWINHIFIVTDRQTPKWLNIAHPKISIVDHSEILPEELIPCFNSSVIERYIARIPGLQEHFLYANDDFFFGEKVSKDFFYKHGRPIARMNYYKNSTKEYSESELDKLYINANLFDKTEVNAWKLLLEKNKLKKVSLWQNHHNIDAFLKSDYIEVIQKYSKELDANIYRSRSEKDIQRVLFSADLIINQRADLKMIGIRSKFDFFRWLLRLRVVDSCCSTAMLKYFFLLVLFRPKLFCINNSGINETMDKREKNFLDWKFPNKSMFEK